MARRWNERDASTDTVYHLGDFAMGDPQRYPVYRHALQGRVVLDPGNHDGSKMERVLARMGFADVLDNVVVEVDGLRLWLNHYPLDIAEHGGRPRLCLL